MRTDGVPFAKQQAQRIIREETMTVVKNKCVKAVGSDDIPVEVRTCPGEQAVDFMSCV